MCQTCWEIYRCGQFPKRKDHFECEKAKSGGCRKRLFKEELVKECGHCKKCMRRFMDKAYPGIEYDLRLKKEEQQNEYDEQVRSQVDRSSRKQSLPRHQPRESSRKPTQKSIHPSTRTLSLIEESPSSRKSDTIHLLPPKPLPSQITPTHIAFSDQRSSASEREYRRRYRPTGSYPNSGYERG